MVMRVEPLAAKYGAFGWDVMRVDGHDMRQVVDALEQARNGKRRPALILVDTVKGKGVSFMEDQAGWHGKAPNSKELTIALEELEVADKIRAEELLEKAMLYQSEVDRTLDAKMPKFTHDYWWNTADTMRV